MFFGANGYNRFPEFSWLLFHSLREQLSLIALYGAAFYMEQREKEEKTAPWIAAGGQVRYA